MCVQKDACYNNCSESGFTVKFPLPSAEVEHRQSHLVCWTAAQISLTSSLPVGTNFKCLKRGRKRGAMITSRIFPSSVFISPSNATSHLLTSLLPDLTWERLCWPWNVFPPCFLSRTDLLFSLAQWACSMFNPETLRDFHYVFRFLSMIDNLLWNPQCVSSSSSSLIVFPQYLLSSTCHIEK